MARTCIKCGYTRRDGDTAPPYACPSCGVVYAKAEAAHAQQAVARARVAAIASPVVAPPAATRPDAGAPNARAEALVQHMLLAQSNDRRGKSPYRGMALAVLIAFAAGFASAAMLYSGAAKLAKQPPRCDCRGA